jgi:hypothetical protein
MGWGRGKKRGPLSEETKAKLRAYIVTDEQRARMSEAQRRRFAGVDSIRRRLDILYAVLFEEQNGMCAICGSRESKSGRPNHQKLCMDHDHQAAVEHGHGKRYCELEVRGLLCNSCNRYLGWLERIGDDTPGQRAFQYLATWNKKKRGR